MVVVPDSFVWMVVVPISFVSWSCVPLVLQRDKFEDMLRRLTAERADVCAAMAFAMDNAESGGRAGGRVGEVMLMALGGSSDGAACREGNWFAGAGFLESTAEGLSLSLRGLRHVADSCSLLQAACSALASPCGRG